MKIKWGGEEAKGSESWDFALVKADSEGSKKYCESKGFTTPAEADWTAVYESLGWNVETKKDNSRTKICIWKVPNGGKSNYWRHSCECLLKNSI